MKLVLVALQVAELGELLVARVELAGERLGGCVHDLVRAHVAALREHLAAHVAFVRTLAGVAPLVRLEIAELREALAAGRLAADKGLDTGVGAGVDVEMRLLIEGLSAVGYNAMIALFVLG